MQTLLKHWTDTLLKWMGLTSAADDGWDRWVAFLLVIVLVVLFDYLCRLLFVRGIRRIVERTRVKWDDELFSTAVLNHSCHILSAILLSFMLPVVFEDDPSARGIVTRLAHVYLVISVFRFVNAILRAAFNIVSQQPAWQNKPIKGLRQTGQGIALLISVILIVSILMDKPPTILLTSLGASAAILLLIFRDSILGFVSGIQLSANNMLKVGDWISVPKYGADGTVEEVSLSTVKIRNWDNTLVMLPPYTLVSESFQNWHAMQLSGGRRVMRSVSIDMTSVKFCTAEMLARYREIDLIREYIDQTERKVEQYNAAHGIEPGQRRINGLHQTNLGVFRAYLLRYLQEEVPVNKNMTLMVRQLQPTETGLPMQLYFFTSTVEWVAYEGIQSDVFDHVLAVVPAFDLRVFQNPSGSDLMALGAQPQVRMQAGCGASGQGSGPLPEGGARSVSASEVLPSGDAPTARRQPGADTKPPNDASSEKHRSGRDKLSGDASPASPQRGPVKGEA